MRTAPILSFAFVAILVFFMAAGCTTKRAKQEKIVPDSKRHELLDGGPFKGVWQTRDLNLSYEYTSEPGRLLMSGVVTFGGHKTLESFFLRVNMINIEGRLVQQHQVASGGGRRPVREIPFESEMKMPEETRGFAFSYEGIARGQGSESGSPHRFWQTPFWAVFAVPHANIRRQCSSCLHR